MTHTDHFCIKFNFNSISPYRRCQNMRPCPSSLCQHWKNIAKAELFLLQALPIPPSSTFIGKYNLPNITDSYQYLKWIIWYWPIKMVPLFQVYKATYCIRSFRCALSVDNLYRCDLSSQQHGKSQALLSWTKSVDYTFTNPLCLYLSIQ